MEIGNNSLNGLGLVSDQTAKYLPEPAVTGSGLFNDVLNVVSSLGSTAIGVVPAVVNGDFASLLNAQLEASREMQSVSMVSNIEKSKHESKMAAIRNIRVS